MNSLDLGTGCSVLSFPAASCLEAACLHPRLSGHVSGTGTTHMASHLTSHLAKIGLTGNDGGTGTTRLTTQDTSHSGPENCMAGTFENACSEAERDAWRGTGAMTVLLYRYLIGLQRNFVCLSSAEVPNGHGGLMSVNTRRKCMSKLQEIQAIFDVRRVRNGIWQGMQFSIGETMKKAFLEVFGEPENSSDYQSLYQSVYSSSSFLNTKKKTTNYTECDILKHPELELWRENGLSANQIGKWAEEFSLDTDVLVTYLKWVAYDIEHKPEDKRINNPVNWIYSCLSRSGGYTKPAGYRSYEEICLEEAGKEIEHNRQLLEELEKARKEQVEISLTKEINRILQEGDTNVLYREAAGKVPECFQSCRDSDVFKHLVAVNLRNRFGLTNGTLS